MPEPEGFFTFDADRNAISRAGFKFRPGDPEGEDWQPGLLIALGPDDVLVRRSPAGGNVFVYLPGGETGALVRAGELFLLPKASADELLTHPTAPYWVAADAPDTPPDTPPVPEVPVAAAPETLEQPAGRQWVVTEDAAFVAHEE